MQEQAVYEIWVKTGKNGLSKAVGLELYGDNGKVAKFSLNDTDRNDFEAGNLDHFQESADNVKDITGGKITSGPRDGDVWALDWIYVYNHSIAQTVFLTNTGAEKHNTHLPHTATLDGSLPFTLKTIGPLPGTAS